jgi:hypothetical protein
VHGNPNSGKSERENRGEHNNLPQYTHAQSRLCCVASQPLNHCLVIALKDNMGAKPCIAPTQNRLQYSKDLLELNIAAAVAPGTPGMPEIFPNSTETFASTCISRDEDIGVGWLDELNTIPVCAQSRPPTDVGAHTRRDVPALKGRGKFDGEVDQTPNKGTRAGDDLHAELEETDKLLNLPQGTGALAAPTASQIAQV